MTPTRAVLWVTVLALSGCSPADGPGEQPGGAAATESVTASASETSGASPSATEEVEEAEETPQAFIRRWQRETVAAQNSGDTRRYRALTPRCDPCTDFADNVDRIYDRGDSVELAGARVVAIRPAPGALQFRLVRVLGRTEVRDARGRVEQSFDGGREVLAVYLEETADGWTVRTFLRT